MRRCKFFQSSRSCFVWAAETTNTPAKPLTKGRCYGASARLDAVGNITGLTIRMLGTSAAYVTCKWKQSQENAGKLETASGRMTLVYERVGKEWKIVHRHTSPDNPDATRPVFPSERLPSGGN